MDSSAKLVSLGTGRACTTWLSANKVDNVFFVGGSLLEVVVVGGVLSSNSKVSGNVPGEFVIVCGSECSVGLLVSSRICEV